MPELDVSHFRKVREELPLPADANSLDAPQRPTALDSEEPLPQSPLYKEHEEGPASQEVLPPTPPLRTRNPLQKIKFDQLTSRRELLRELNQILPLNEFNLPRYIYRADLLDPCVIQELYQHDTNLNPSAQFPRRTSAPLLPMIPTPREGEVSVPACLTEALPSVEEYLNAAVVHLLYDQGFPTTEDGKPIWSQFQYESVEAYSAFLEYLQLDGVRTFTRLPSFAPELLAEWFQLYYWNQRATAYDMFRSAHHTRVRMQRIMHTEDVHYVEAERLFSRINKAIKDIPDDKLSEVEPDKLVHMLEKVSRLQRVAAGLPAQGGLPEDKQPQAMSVEVQMRHIAKNNDQPHQIDEGFDTDLLLQDPDALATAQELIIRVNGGK